MPAPDNIKDLVKHFEEHREVYRLGKYNETQLPGSPSNVHHPLLQANEKVVFGELEKNEMKIVIDQNKW